MVRVLYLFLLLVVLSPINAFADYQRDTSNDEIYLELVQSAKDTVWNIGYIDVKAELVFHVPINFIISSNDDVN